MMYALRRSSPDHASPLPAPSSSDRLATYCRAHALACGLGIPPREAARLCVEIMMARALTTPRGDWTATAPVEIAAAMLERVREWTEAAAGAPWNRGAVPPTGEVAAVPSPLHAARERAVLTTTFGFSAFQQARILSRDPALGGP